MRIICVLILSFAILSCGKTKPAPTEIHPPIVIKADSSNIEGLDYNAQFKLENYLAGEPADTSKIQRVNFRCAILIYPTHDQVEEMKKTNGEDEFYTIADDNNFYQTQAMQLLDSAGIKTIGTTKQFLKLVGNGSQWTLDIRKKNLPEWNLILFNPDKSPQVAPTINLTYEMVKSYFNEK